MLQLISTLFFLSSILLFSACAPKTASQEESTLLRSYRLIDDNKVDDAISLLTDATERLELENSLQNEEEIKDLKVTLASAYAKKAGITIKEIAKAADLAKKTTSFNIKKELIEKNTLIKISEQSQQMFNFFVTILRSTRVISIIPKIKAAKLDYLKQSIKILNSVPNLGPDDLVYSALIKIIYVRNFLDQSLLGKSITKLEKVNNQCVANFSIFRDHLLRATQTLSSAYGDVGKAMPKKKTEIVKGLATLDEMTKNLIQFKAAQVIVDNVMASSLENIFVELGFGSQNLSCEFNVQTTQ